MTRHKYLIFQDNTVTTPLLSCLIPCAKIKNVKINISVRKQSWQSNVISLQFSTML